MESLFEAIGDVSPNYELRKLKGSEHEELVKFVKDKICTNGDRFSGFVDVVTGELISGKRVSMVTQECYEGTFLHGERHGSGVCTKLSGEGKFIGTFANDSYEQGTLITSTYTYVGLFSGGVFHGLDGSTYIGDWNNDRKDGIGKHSYDEERDYEGEFVNDQRHGKGKLTTLSAILVGHWRKGRPLDGPGWTIQYPKAGVQYVGDVIACRPHGHGVLSFSNQDSNLEAYEGEVLCGLRHGFGRSITSRSEPRKKDERLALWKGDQIVPSANDGNESSETSVEMGHNAAGIVEPDLVDADSLESNTSHVSPRRSRLDHDESEDGANVDIKISQNVSGIQYVETSGKDMMEGQGSIQFPDGSKYTGSLKDGMMHGQGTFHDTTNQTVYVGDFFHSLKHGQGEEEHADGNVYVGPFVNGIRSGDEGCLYRKTPGGRSLIYEGQWVNNTMTGQGKCNDLITPCKGSYSGEFQDGKRHGRGSFVSNDGLKFEGDWVDDAACDGDWVITYPDGAVYYGSALCRYGIPVPDGFGTQQDKDYTFYCGAFRMGKRHGNGMCIFSSGVQWDGRWDDGVPTQSGANIRRASMETITKCHLFCGSASHVLLRCGGKAFNIRGFPELTRKVGRIPWDTYLAPDTILKVRATCAKSKLFHTTAVEERVEAAVYKAMGRSGSDDNNDTNGNSNSSRPTVELLVRVHRDVVQLSIDTSKTPLHQREYRLETAKAPLREDIAFSMLYAAGLHNSNSYQKLIDPMCGSGTIAIEGAAIKLGLPPGRLRDAPLEGTVFYKPELWNELLSQAMEKSETIARDLGSDPIVMAGDRDDGAIKAAIANAERAGVLQHMDIAARSVSDHDWSSSPTTESVLVATNPPFGKRVSSSREKSARRFDELLPLYQTLGNKIAGMNGNVGAAVLTNNVDLARRMGLKDIKALFSTQHGGLPVAAMGSSNLQNPIFADSLKIYKK
ncbi:hypothetical protein MHU86_20425 [Fragilaria crotonensis]|nr:hypothetical protein MHU86_20425 [Fragilaria crotonensis]